MRPLKKSSKGSGSQKQFQYTSEALCSFKINGFNGIIEASNERKIPRCFDRIRARQTSSQSCTRSCLYTVKQKEKQKQKAAARRKQQPDPDRHLLTFILFSMIRYNCQLQKQYALPYPTAEEHRLWPPGRNHRNRLFPAGDNRNQSSSIFLYQRCRF